MRRQTRESGAALILLLGITATLAILAATAVFVLANQQSATAADRTRDQSFNYAEAGLDSAVMAVRTTSWPAANASFAQGTLTAAYDATYPSGSRPQLTVHGLRQPAEHQRGDNLGQRRTDVGHDSRRQALGRGRRDLRR